ncbi:MAG: hypothetical protein EOO01_13975 [Chitinophagaceae bacterium]|nr:MAG: hypothetical protein EOO01_13975 [Chitinophagaceae bacterium]
MHSDYMYACFGKIGSVIYAVTLSLLLCRCRPAPVQVVLKNPEGYNMRKAVQLKLPLELDEISGVAYHPGDSSVFAINDEKGWLYKIKRGQQIQTWKFSPGADFEDVVLRDSAFYVLRSNGDIIRLSFNGTDQPTVQQFYFSEQGESKNEFEILYYDSTRAKLMLICKDCEMDKKKSLTAFTFDPASGKYTGSPFSINVQNIASAIGEEKMKFKPSAASINPRNGLLYIISAINKLIVVTDVNGNIKEVCHIDPGIFKQPEGISFTPAGGMIISNESADIGVADILFFPYFKK